MINSTIRRIGTLCLLLAMVVSFIFSLDPTMKGFGVATVPILKYMPYWLSFTACILFYVTGMQGFKYYALPIFIFILIMLIGSISSYIANGDALEETYVGRALSGFVFVAFYWLGKYKSELKLFIKIYFPSLLVASFVMASIVVLYRFNLIYADLVQMYQVEVGFFTVSAAFSIYYIKNKYFGKIMATVYLCAVFMVVKTTAILAGIVTIAWIVQKKLSTIKFVQRSSEERLKLIIFFSILVTSIVSLFLYTGFNVLVTRLASRDEEVRALTFIFRIDEFLSSPFVGSFFTSSPLIDIASLHIPSHSDILDLLAFGGLLTVFLLFLPILITVKKNIFIQIGKKDLRSIFALYVVIFILIMLVNPILAVPRLGFFFWMALGLLVRQQVIYLNSPRVIKQASLCDKYA